MKRKLLIGLGLLIIEFVLSGIFIVLTLHKVTVVSDLENRQERIVNNYDSLLYSIKSDQAELYAFEAGYRLDLDALRRGQERIGRLLSSLANEYAIYSSATACDSCHAAFEKANGSKAKPGQIYHGQSLKKIYESVSAYQEIIREILGSAHVQSNQKLVENAARKGGEVEGIVYKEKNRMDERADRLEEFELALVRRSRHMVTLAVIASIVLSGVIVVLTVRSITGPVNALVSGIRKVYSGDYAAKVDIRAKDEMGFLAGTFNQMTEKLGQVTAEREAFMKELKDLNNSLEQRVQAATAELKLAHEKMLRNETLSAVGTFAAGVAHELATPISSIMNYFQMVKGKIPKEDRLAEDVHIIEGELRRCYGILRGMLDLARVPEAERVLTDVNEMIHDLLALVRYQPAYKKTIAIEEALGSGIPLLPGVPGQLREVFMNIIVNALQSMPDGGTLRVSTSMSEDNEKLVVSISDTGYGIPQGDLKNVFQPFYTSRRSGTGLGLSISYGIIRSHGGDMEVISEEGKGTTFSVYLPISVDAEAERNASSGGSAGIGGKE